MGAGVGAAAGVCGDITMICPNCCREIDDKLIAAYLASKGGSKSRRTLTTEQAQAMQAARQAKRLNAKKPAV